MSSKKKKKAVASAKVAPKQSESKAVNEQLTSKLLPCILLALAAPLTVCFFGPFDLYYGNMSLLTFSLGDFLPLCILIAFLCAAVIFVVLMLLRGIAYRIVSAVIAWISIMLFVQRSYLNMGIDAVAGDGVGTATVGTGDVVINLIIWLALGAAMIFATLYFEKAHSDTVKTVVAIAMVTLIGMQTVSFLTVSLTSDIYVPVTERREVAEQQSEAGSGDVEARAAKEPEVLTFENLTRLSSKKNVVVFIVDRFDVNYANKMFKTDPLFFSKLDGFTYYNDYISLYGRTYPAICSMLTGKPNDFEGKKTEYFADAYKNNDTLTTLAKNGYSVNLYTEKVYAYEDASVMLEYADNTSGVNAYEIDSKWGLAADMLRLSLSQYLPFVMKGIVGEMSTSTFNDHAVYDTDEEMYTSDMKAVYDYITDNEFTTVSDENNFSFIHLTGCHIPITYGENFVKLDEDDRARNDTNLAIKLSFTIIYEYIEQMKALGIYDDATIVITGDHPAARSDTKLPGTTGYSGDNGTRVTAMFFKPSGKSGTELDTSTAQISQVELWATIFESEGIEGVDMGDSFFDIAEGEDRVRTNYFQQSDKKEVNGRDEDYLIRYEITGCGTDPDSWRIVEEKPIGNIYK